MQRKKPISQLKIEDDEEIRILRQEKERSDNLKRQDRLQQLNLDSPSKKEDGIAVAMQFFKKQNTPECDGRLVTRSVQVDAGNDRAQALTPDGLDSEVEGSIAILQTSSARIERRLRSDPTAFQDSFSYAVLPTTNSVAGSTIHDDNPREPEDDEIPYCGVFHMEIEVPFSPVSPGQESDEDNNRKPRRIGN